MSLRTSLSAFIIILGSVSANARDYEVVDVSPGETVDVYFQFNMTGNVYLKVQDASGPACVDLWWIKWPFGNIDSLGRKCGFVELEIPGILQFSISSKLRAGGASKPTKIGYTADERVAHSITISFP